MNAHAGRCADHRAHESRSIEWYAEGQTRAVEIHGVRITVRLVGRKGRRARIAITAPVGAAFRTMNLTEHTLLTSAKTGIIGGEPTDRNP